MKSAEDVALKIAKDWHNVPGENFKEANTKALANLITKALTAYADERVKEALLDEANKAKHFLNINEVRAEALKEAAKVADEFVMADGDHGTEIGQAIRALKEKA